MWVFCQQVNHMKYHALSHIRALHRGSYMRAIVLLDLLNELRKRDKIWGLLSILSLFHKKFNKFNNTGAQMLDSIYHLTLKLLWNSMIVAIIII